jgi:hypothetical protein
MGSSADLPDILRILDFRLNDKGKNWRHVYKVRMRVYPSKLYMLRFY